jgi:hypothetical protein
MFVSPKALAQQPAEWVNDGLMIIDTLARATLATRSAARLLDRTPLHLAAERDSA